MVPDLTSQMGMCSRELRRAREDCANCSHEGCRYCLRNLGIALLDMATAIGAYIAEYDLTGSRLSIQEHECNRLLSEYETVYRAARSCVHVKGNHTQ